MNGTKRAFRVAVIPGDGIGTEVMPEGLRVLEAATRRFGLELELTDSAIAHLSEATPSGPAQRDHAADILALRALADEGAVEPAVVQKAIGRFGIDADAPAPWAL